MTRGIYFMANDRVAEHAIALVNSIRAFDRSTPIVMIPYDDEQAEVSRLMRSHYAIETFADAAALRWIDEELDRCFGAGFFRRPRNFRKQACWLGAFDEFLYLDADIVVFEPIAALLDALAGADFVCCDDQHCGGLTHVFREPIRSRFSSAELAQIFNGGLWGARAAAIGRAELSATWRDCARHPQWFDFAHGGSDQPILNYLVLTRLPRRRNLFVAGAAPRMWAGTPGLTWDGARLVDPAVDEPVRFLHWAGRPIGPGGPYWDVWRHFRELDPRLPPSRLPPVAAAAPRPAGWAQRAGARLRRLVARRGAGGETS